MRAVSFAPISSPEAVIVNIDFFPRTRFFFSGTKTFTSSLDVSGFVGSGSFFDVSIGSVDDGIIAFISSFVESNVAIFVSLNVDVDDLLPVTEVLISSMPIDPPEREYRLYAGFAVAMGNEPAVIIGNEPAAGNCVEETGVAAIGIGGCVATDLLSFLIIATVVVVVVVVMTLWHPHFVFVW